ncbi:alpha-galactosidase [Siphonobacter sp. BAB-5385]|uniref:alpha-galactosidase n=1 Tax=Siphonobacter sp. BAB-5385 TaxID=1864822 RepID=UPI0020CCED44|nr:alpha-galactosidase [Siphonobacter sp. BAB-5385]
MGRAVNLPGFRIFMSLRIGLSLGLVLVSLVTSAQSSLTSCRAELVGDTLRLGNAFIERLYLFNQGQLRTVAVIDKARNKRWNLNSQHPDFSFPNTMVSASVQGSFTHKNVAATATTPAYVQAEVLTPLGDLWLKRVFRIYPDCPAIACDYYLKGHLPFAEQRGEANAYDLRNIESQAAQQAGQAQAAFMDRLTLPSLHVQAKAVEFFDATDQNNTLVQEYPRLAYRQEVRLRGNLLFFQEVGQPTGWFFLKEAPVSGVQLAYPGFDFTLKTNEVKVAGLGIAPQDLRPDIWVRGYSVVLGLSDGTETGALLALRSYQRQLRQSPADEMILLNTWGDRGQDKNINESFVREELKRAARLGITHFQLDDGWQQGKSANSAFQGGSFTNIWQKPDYWRPDPAKFPNGFTSLRQDAEKAGISLSTWFNPSIDSSFKYWDKDASVLIDQYRTYGIHMWKIDGVRIADKQAELNFRKMLDTVMQVTQGKALFNLDVTAGRRFGYHYFYEYGNLFLENRYTDWANYYPHYTLRNLWMLSRYVPPQRLQIEFLNKWRNTDKYPKDDPYSPGRYSFDYLFAVTMPGQPLAWMEARNLPEEAFTLSELISVYRKHSRDWHRGAIFPVGDTPTGTSWTGFQSLPDSPNVGYVLVFRENHPQSQGVFSLMKLRPGRYSFTLLAGEGKSFRTQVGTEAKVAFQLPTPRSFGWYRYEKMP